MRYLIGLLITIAVIIFIIIRLLAGGNNTAPNVQAGDLARFANTDTLVRMTIENPVQAAQDHRIVQITVGRDSTDFVVYRGYANDIVRAKSFEMNESAYRDFLRSLQLSGKYTQGNNDPAFKDEHGYCAIGDRYVYEIIDENGTVTQHYWSTSCGQKTFKGDADTVQRLFETQVPNYFELTTDVEL